MYQLIPQQPHEANSLQRIFGEIIRDFKTYHTTSNPDFKGSFSIEDKVFKLSKVFDVFNENCQKDAIAFAQLYVQSNLNTELQQAIDDKDELLTKQLKKRAKGWKDGTPEKEDSKEFIKTVNEILYRYCFQRNAPVGGEGLGDCGFIEGVRGYLVDVSKVKL